MTVEETIQILHSIEDRASDFPNMTACDWVAIVAAKRHLSTLKGVQKNILNTEKDKWVEKTCKWLESIAEYIGHDSETIKKSFKKYMNSESQRIKKNT